MIRGAVGASGQLTYERGWERGQERYFSGGISSRVLEKPSKKAMMRSHAPLADILQVWTTKEKAGTPHVDSLLHQTLYLQHASMI